MEGVCEGAVQGMNWKDWREEQSNFAEEDPAVLVAGKVAFF